MKFSTKERYGIRVMYELAKNYGNEKSLYQKEIAEAQLLPNKYLDQIVVSLKNSQLIYSPKGKRSGYILTKKPSEITILEIYNAFSNGLYVIDCLAPFVTCANYDKCPSINFWQGLNDIVSNYFEKNTLQDLLDNSISK